MDYRNCPEPYFSSKDGSSSTAAAIRYFLGEAVKLRDSIPSSWDSLQTVYKKRHPDPTKTYIGRAAHSPSTTANSNEEYWCMLADIEKASEWLEESEETLLCYLIAGLNEEEIAEELEITKIETEILLQNLFGRIAYILDYCNLGDTYGRDVFRQEAKSFAAV